MLGMRNYNRSNNSGSGRNFGRRDSGSRGFGSRGPENRCLEWFVQNAVKIVKFPLNQETEDPFFVATV